MVVATARAEEPESQTSKPAVPEPLSTHTEEGFISIFDSRTLQHWDGDPRYWRIEHGAIVGETTKANPLQTSTFIIWRGGELKDFELKLEYRISSQGNSGVYYRGEEAAQPKWTLGGYQADIDGPDWGKDVGKYLRHLGIKFPTPHSATGVAEPADSLRVTGQNYDETADGRGRAFLALPGEITYVPDGKAQRVIGYLEGGAKVDTLSTDDWNEMHIIASGNVLIHILNSQVVSVVIDDDVKHRRRSGKLGLQLHPGEPMKVEFRHIRFKSL